VTFDELKSRSAADLREIAKFLEHRAKQIEAGDLQVMDKLVDEEWGRWFEMLFIRYAWGQEQRKAADYREPSTNSGDPKHG
jgi:hypothetical protein